MKNVISFRLMNLHFLVSMLLLLDTCLCHREEEDLAISSTSPDLVPCSISDLKGTVYRAPITLREFDTFCFRIIIDIDGVFEFDTKSADCATATFTDTRTIGTFDFGLFGSSVFITELPGASFGDGGIVTVKEDSTANAVTMNVVTEFFGQSLFEVDLILPSCTSSAEQSLRSNKSITTNEGRRIQTIDTSYAEHPLSHLILDNSRSKEKELVPSIMTKRHMQATQIGDDIQPASGTDCGHAVDISGDGNHVIVGCPGTNNGKGSAHIYQFSSNRWTEIETNTFTSRGNNGERYGFSVSLAKNDGIITAAAGDFKFNNNIGRVRIVKYDVESPNTTLNNQRIPAPNNSPQLFGYDINLSGNGNKIAVGALGLSGQSPSTSIFNYDSTQERWNVDVDKTITSTFNSNPKTIDVSVSNDGNVRAMANAVNGQDSDNDAVIVSNVQEDFEIEGVRKVSISSNGRVIALGYPFVDCNDGDECGTVEIRDTTLLSQDSRIGRFIFEDPNERCGKSLDLSFDGETLVIGCENRVHVYTRNDQDEWENVYTQIIDNVQSVAISGNARMIIVGSKSANNANNRGLVQVLSATPRPPSPTRPSPTRPSPTRPSPTRPSPTRCAADEVIGKTYLVTMNVSKKKKKRRFCYKLELFVGGVFEQDMSSATKCSSATFKKKRKISVVKSFDNYQISLKKPKEGNKYERRGTIVLKENNSMKRPRMIEIDSISKRNPKFKLDLVLPSCTSPSAVPSPIPSLKPSLHPTKLLSPSKYIQFVGNPCTKYSANGKCNECTGDCDADSDCAGELRCAKRARASQNVPGCAWGLADRNENEVDYCFKPVSKPAGVINYIGECDRSSYKCKRCEGDCDSDSDCEGDLVCYERDGFEAVKGCTGEGGERDVYAKDICSPKYQTAGKQRNGRLMA